MALFQVNFFSQCMRRSVPLNVLIPCDRNIPGVRSREHAPFRTLYLLHGYDGDRMDWLISGDAQETSQRYDIAIVMPSGDNGFYTDNPEYDKHDGEFISRELVAYTRKIFPILSHKRENTYIGGLSMGGYGTLYNALRSSDVFGHAIALSAPMMEPMRHLAEDSHRILATTQGFYESAIGSPDSFTESDTNLRYLAARVHAEGRDCPDLYLACGYNDLLVHDNRLFHRYLTELGVPHFYEEGAGTHEWAFWREFLKRGLERSIPVTETKHPFWIERDKEGLS